MQKLAFATVAPWATIASAHAQIVTKYSGIQPVDHPSSYAESTSPRKSAFSTKGTIKVEVYHNTQLGDAVANVQSIRNGTIGFTTVSASNLNQVVPAMDMYSPAVPVQERSAFLVVPGAAAGGRNFVKPLEDKGIKILAYLDSGARNLFTQKRCRHRTT